MAKLTLTTVAAAGLALSGLTFVGCHPAPAPKAQESAGEYIDDSVITTKVKAAIVDEPSLKSSQISVKTYQNVVQLSGFVDSSGNVKRAGQLASAVHGVHTVKNDLIVK